MTAAMSTGRNKKYGYYQIPSGKKRTSIPSELAHEIVRYTIADISIQFNIEDLRFINEEIEIIQGPKRKIVAAQHIEILSVPAKVFIHPNIYVSKLPTVCFKKKDLALAKSFKILGWKMGFEPTTLGTTNRCSNQLSYNHQIILYRYILMVAKLPVPRSKAYREATTTKLSYIATYLW